MKTKLFLFISLTIFGYSYCQVEIGWEEHIIADDVDGRYSVFSADINDDGYMDVISAEDINDIIAWYENDGDGNFGSQQIITTNADGAKSVYAADLDGDGDMDVLSASWDDNKIAWYENTDGQGNFDTHIITTNADGAMQVHAADIDGDDDMDVLSASENDDTIAWYENDGDGNFVSHVISTSQDGSRSVYTADINDDGYMDVLAASQNDGKVAWYENTDGLGSFGTEIIISTNGSAWRVTASDLNGDGFMDVIALLDDDKIELYLNDEQGNFTVIVISTNSNGGEWVYAEDMDNDGDKDVLCANFFGDSIYWHENFDENGNGTAWEEHIIQGGVDGASSVHAANINDDGLMDVIATGRFYGKVVWFEQVILGVDENTLLNFSVYPNPTTGILNILSQKGNPINSIQIYDILGRLVLEEKDDFNQLDVSNLDSGVLFVKIQTTEGVVTKKIIKE